MKQEWRRHRVKKPGEEAVKDGKKCVSTSGFIPRKKVKNVNCHSDSETYINYQK